MGYKQGRTFVLWGRYFEEALATVFVTEFRKTGVFVEIVGICPQQIQGLHGITLSPDITLEHALTQVEDVACVIVPCDKLGFQRLENDPRIIDFLGKAHGYGALFIMNHVSLNKLTDSTMLQILLDHTAVSPDSEYLVKTARQIAHFLKR